jgi:hypothetical protein
MEQYEYSKSVLALGEALTDLLHLYGGSEDSVKFLNYIPGEGFIINTNAGRKFKVEVTSI